MVWQKNSQPLRQISATFVEPTSQNGVRVRIVYKLSVSTIRSLHFPFMMAGPNLEIFRFGLYLFVPLFALLHFGDPSWYHNHVLPVSPRINSMVVACPTKDCPLVPRKAI